MANYSVSNSGTGVVDSGPITTVGGLALIFNVVGLYSYTGVALAVFGYIALTAWISSLAMSTAKNRAAFEAGMGLLVFSWLVALVGGVLVGAFHCVAYEHAAYAVLSVYTLANLVWLLQRTMSATWCCLFPAIGAAMLTVVVQLGAPPGSDDMQKKESWTPVTVTALDEHGQPIEGATVVMDLLYFWQSDPKVDGDHKWWAHATTGSDGTARLSLHEDPRFKRLLIRVRREPFGGGYNEPATIGQYAGYEDARVQTVIPVPKVPYTFQVEMKERTHPDYSLLAIRLNGDGSAEPWQSRSIKVALTTDPQLPWHENRRTFDEDDVSTRGKLRDVFLRDSGSLVLHIGRQLVERPLTLHVLERDSSQYQDAYLEVQTISIDPVRLGENRSIDLPALARPVRHSISAGSGPDLR